MVEIFSKLGVDETIFLQFGIFIILSVLLKKLLFNPLQVVIEGRSEQTSGLESKADKILVEGNKIKEETEEKINAKRNELYTELKSKKDSLEAQLAERFSRSESEAESQYEESLSELNDELSKVNEQLSQNTDELSSLLTTKLTK